MAMFKYWISLRAKRRSDDSKVMGLKTVAKNAYQLFSSLTFNAAPKKQKPAAPRQRAKTVPISAIQNKNALTIINPATANNPMRLAFELFFCSILQKYAFLAEYQRNTSGSLTLKMHQSRISLRAKR